MKVLFAAALAALTLCAALSPAGAGAVLDRVTQAGTLNCGVPNEPEDWGKDDVHAALPQFGHDLCRALAAAVLGSPDRARIVDTPSAQFGFQGLKAGRIDVLMGASPSAAAGVAFGVVFARPVFYDGDALLVHRGAGIARFDDLAGRLVCYVPGTPAEAVLQSEAARRHVVYRPWPFEENGELLGAVAGRKCDALFGSASRLADDLTGFHARKADFVLLDERYSVLPFAPALADGDAAWREVVDAVADAPVRAEAAHVTAARAGDMTGSHDPLLRDVGGTLPGVDAAMVPAGWAARAVAVAGNQGELYDRDLGAGSDLHLPRGANALWTQGGLMVPQPLR